MIDFLDFDFMRRALIAGLAIGFVSPMLGSFLVVRRYALLTDTLAHVSLLGIVLGLVLGISPLFSAVVLALLGAFGMEQLRVKTQGLNESVLAIFLTGSLALAVVLMSVVQGEAVGLSRYLFGSISTVGKIDVWIVVAVSVLAACAVLGAYRWFFLAAFSEEIAEAKGLPGRRTNLFLVLLSALVIAVSIRIVGALLVGALMVLPVLTSARVSKSFRGTMIGGIVLSIFSVLSGLILSFYWNIPSGGSIVLVALACFVISFLVRPRS